MAASGPPLVRLPEFDRMAVPALNYTVFHHERGVLKSAVATRVSLYLTIIYAYVRRPSHSSPRPAISIMPLLGSGTGAAGV
jgi:hypothetical protein